MSDGPVRVAILDDYQDVAREFGPWERLAGRVELTVFDDHLADPEPLAARLAGFPVVVAMRERTPFPAALLARLPALRLLVTTGARNASIDVAAARAQGVVVCGTRGSATAAAELTWALILGLLRHVAAEDRAVREGRWQHTVGGDLAGRRLGVLGHGRLGRQVAAVGVAFGMDVVAWSRSLTPGAEVAPGVRAVALDELLRSADVASIHLPLVPGTRGLIGARELELLGPQALLVNSSRGPIVDEAALLAALADGRLGGAALDVYDVEPLPVDHPLRRAPRTLLTPHVGYVTRGSYATFFADAVEDVEAFLDGAPLRVLEA
ncbi:D-2-hydroxyacid dehydrogenase family protein [Patulibacter defluvii]|uniref:D-2-hydroxyacid dehydrogenase family protein n=1 Tax=Patulibacter defluvii TaxID=3095358 RepID=UPI002A7501EE|nr:D-2-hydroxyacid dehydrogenase family protein [Patulibacter sp. DM4]